MPRKLHVTNFIQEVAEAAPPALTLLHASHPANRRRSSAALAMYARRGALSPTILGALVAAGIVGLAIGRLRGARR